MDEAALLFLAIVVTGHLNMTWYANVNGHLAEVLSHHWRLQYNNMQDNHIESNHDSDMFPMRFFIQWLLQVKFAIYDGNFELPEMVVALSYAYVWKFHYIFDQEDLIVWSLVLILYILDHWILVTYKVVKSANFQTQGAHQ
jgi:hypothetical protein